VQSHHEGHLVVQIENIRVHIEVMQQALPPVF
jgi:hypothetical protein